VRIEPYGIEWTCFYAEFTSIALGIIYEYGRGFFTSFHRLYRAYAQAGSALIADQALVDLRLCTPDPLYVVFLDTNAR
jgi:hypothetical protein